MRKFLLILILFTVSIYGNNLSETSKKIVKFVHPSFAYPSLLLSALYTGYKGSRNMFVSILSGIGALFPHRVTGGGTEGIGLKKLRRYLIANSGIFLGKSSLWFAVSSVAYEKANEIKTLLKD